MESVQNIFQRVYGHAEDGMLEKPMFKLLCAVIFLIPFTLFFAPLYRDMSEDALSVKSRPTKAAYTAAWVIILILMAFSSIPFIRSATSNLQMMVAFVHILLIVVLGWMWVVYYKKDKSKGISIFVFILMVVLATLIFYYTTSPVAAVMISPLLVWAITQYTISAKELDNMLMIPK